METATGRELQVPREMECLNKATMELEKSVEGLFEKLVPLLVQQPPIEGTGGGDPKENLVPLASDIKAATRSIRISVGKIESLRGRLEL